MNAISTRGSELVARRVARDLPPVGLWVAPELPLLRTLLGDRAAGDRREASVIVLAIDQVSEAGDVTVADPWPAAHLLGVFQGPVRIVRRCPAPLGRVKRVFSELGVLDVTPAGLVIVELARGVSAVDMQARAEPTLLISPRVALMEAQGSGITDQGSGIGD